MMVHPLHLFHQHHMYLNHPLLPPVQLPIIPAHPIQPAHVPQLNWSNFKTEFTGKPDEDAEAHLLRMNDWSNTHAFQEGVKVQHFCLTLIEEGRLWHETFRPINIDQIGLQNQFRQQYNKIGNTREPLSHAWKLFHFSENTEMLDSYVICIRQLATLVVYGEPQVLEVFKIHFLQDYIGYYYP